MANSVLNQFGTNKESLLSYLQELKGGQPTQGTTERKSAIFRELDQF